MKFEIKNSTIASYKRLSYDPWYAFAEFVDNSTQAYLDHKEEMDTILEKEGEKLKVEIFYNYYDDIIIIKDNSVGMNENELDKALKVGVPPDNPRGRSRYGLGMKTSACWFGNNWSIKTKRLNETYSISVNINVDDISKSEGEYELTTEKETAKNEEHYTIITIRNLNKSFWGRTLGKITSFLSSMYRFDFSEYGLELFWNGRQLEWEGLEDKLYKNVQGEKAKKSFTFEVNGKEVKGWVGVLGKGNASRKLGGFSIVQNKRIIENSYKPTSIFGDQEDGSNDLVNQRVTGEIFLENFEVSHTKDKIVWQGNEEEDLDKKLGEICADMRELARTLRFTKENETDEFAIYKEEAVTQLSSEFKSSELNNYVATIQPYPENVIKSSYLNIIKSVESEDPVIKVNVGSDGDTIRVVIYFRENSEFEPYIVTETAFAENEVVIIINLLHPHLREMKSADSLTNFIRHCVYDGVSEWKAIKLRGSIQPNTIRFLKDGLLRIPYEIKQNTFA